MSVSSGRPYLRENVPDTCRIDIKTKAHFKRRATAVPNLIDRTKFDFSTAVARLGFKRRAAAVPNSIHEL